MIQPKTAYEWFNELDEPYRTQAINNSNIDRLTTVFGRLSSALICSFNWEGSSQGHRYWEDLHKSLRNQLK